MSLDSSAHAVPAQHGQLAPATGTAAEKLTSDRQALMQELAELQREVNRLTQQRDQLIDAALQEKQTAQRLAADLRVG